MTDLPPGKFVELGREPSQVTSTPEMTESTGSEGHVHKWILTHSKNGVRLWDCRCGLRRRTISNMFEEKDEIITGIKGSLYNLLPISVPSTIPVDAVLDGTASDRS